MSETDTASQTERLLERHTQTLISKPDHACCFFAVVVRSKTKQLTTGASHAAHADPENIQINAPFSPFLTLLFSLCLCFLSFCSLSNECSFYLFQGLSSLFELDHLPECQFVVNTESVVWRHEILEKRKKKMREGRLCFVKRQNEDREDRHTLFSINLPKPRSASESLNLCWRARKKEKE